MRSVVLKPVTRKNSRFLSGQFFSKHRIVGVCSFALLTAVASRAACSASAPRRNLVTPIRRTLAGSDSVRGPMNARVYALDPDTLGFPTCVLLVEVGRIELPSATPLLSPELQQFSLGMASVHF